MNKIDEISMLIISYAGTARSLSIQMIDQAEEGKEITSFISEIEEWISKAQTEHHNLIQSSDISTLTPTILFVHAEDQLMSAETLFIVAKKMCNLIKENKERK